MANNDWISACRGCVDVYTALAGVIGALYGPLHGGANEAILKMLNEIGPIDNIPEFIEGVKHRKRKMSGFGIVYTRTMIPERGWVIKKLAEEVFSSCIQECSLLDQCKDLFSSFDTLGVADETRHSEDEGSEDDSDD